MVEGRYGDTLSSVGWHKYGDKWDPAGYIKKQEAAAKATAKDKARIKAEEHLKQQILALPTLLRPKNWQILTGDLGK